MNSFVVILSCLVALAAANPTQNVIVGFTSSGRATCRQNCNRPNPLNNCPPTNCPPPVRDGFCGEVDCSIPGNRVVLHPTLDPNYYYQCAPYDAVGTWRPIRRPCACETIFSTRYNRCVHLHEWVKDCPGQPDRPIFKECIEDCLTCDDDVVGGPPPVTQPPWTPPPVTQPPWTPPPVTQPPWTPPPVTQPPWTPPPVTQPPWTPPPVTQPPWTPPPVTQPPWTPPPVTQPPWTPPPVTQPPWTPPPVTQPPWTPPPVTQPPPVGTPGPDNCECPCAPCVWWPCMPCMPVCACNNQNQQRPQLPQQPQNPWQRPAPGR